MTAPTRPVRPLAAVVAAMVLAAAGLAGAAPGDDAGKEPAVSWGIERVFGRGGPVELVVRVDKAELDLSQDLVIEEELRIEDGFEADFPDLLPEDLDGLGLARVKDLPASREGKLRIERRRLEVEPERTGDCALAERWAFFRREGDPKAPEKTIATEAIKVHVAAIPEGVDRTPPPPPAVFLEDPEAPARTAWIPWGLGLIAALALAAWAARRLRGEAKAPPPVPAHVVAEQALARLDALDLLTKGDVDGFFVTLSAILRDYVERRFGVRAPEQTTAEFLAALGRRPGLTGHRDLLRSFLTLADGVKFAREQPEAADARAARQTVAEFVSATRADRAPTPAGAAA